MDWGGSFENLQEASARLAVLVPLVLLLIFVLLQANFRSTRITLLVYANVPMAVTGGLAPNQRPVIAKLGLRALAAGSLANLMSAALAGLFLPY